MTTSQKLNNNGSNFRVWLRLGHRWLGLTALLFVLLLSVTGIALNHSSDWGLDHRYVTWEWPLRALGIHAPEPTASFADGDHRVTQIGERMYFDTIEFRSDTDSLRGLVVLEPLAAVATSRSVVLLSTHGEFVERLDLSADLPGTIERIGSADQRVVLESGRDYFIGDLDISSFLPWPEGSDADVTWSTVSRPTPEQVAGLKALYRGRGLTVERLLIEIHSGRILAAAGPAVLDVVAVVLIVLSLSGIAVWLSGRSRSTQTRR